MKQHYGKKIVHIMMGVPGSGKSTLANKWQETFGGVMLSSDEIRTEIFDADQVSRLSHNHFASVRTFQILFERFERAASEGKEIYLDSVNLERKYRAKYFPIARRWGYEVHAELVLLDESECVQRICNRERNGQAAYHIENPEKVVAKWARQLEKEPPTFEEGFDVINTYSNGKLVKTISR